MCKVASKCWCLAVGISKVQGLLGPDEGVWAICCSSSVDAPDTEAVAGGVNTCESHAPIAPIVADTPVHPDGDGKARCKCWARSEGSDMFRQYKGSRHF